MTTTIPVPNCRTLHADDLSEYEQGHARGVALGRLLQKIEDAVHRVHEDTIDIHDIGRALTHCETWGWNLKVASRDGDQVTVRVYVRMGG